MWPTPFSRLSARTLELNLADLFRIGLSAQSNLDPVRMPHKVLEYRRARAFARGGAEGGGDPREPYMKGTEAASRLEEAQKAMVE